VYTSQPHHKPELARHYYVRSDALERRDDKKAAMAMRLKAQRCYEDMVPYAMRIPLSLSVLNDIVAPWVW
jgi:hypothetical protein